MKYEQIFIKTEEDLPEDKGMFYWHWKQHELQDIVLREYYPNDPDYWIECHDWYLKPLPEDGIKESRLSEEKINIKRIEKILENASMYGRPLSDFLLPDQREILSRYIATELSSPQVKEDNPFCPYCGKYKTMQGNGIMHQLCECGVQGKEVSQPRQKSEEVAAPLTDEEREAIEFIAENPECEKYWLSKVRHFMNGDEPTDDSCELADEWQKQFEIAMKAFLRQYHPALTDEQIEK